MQVIARLDGNQRDAVAAESRDRLFDRPQTGLALTLKKLLAVVIDDADIGALLAKIEPDPYFGNAHVPSRPDRRSAIFMPPKAKGARHVHRGSPALSLFARRRARLVIRIRGLARAWLRSPGPL